MPNFTAEFYCYTVASMTTVPYRGMAWRGVGRLQRHVLDSAAGAEPSDGPRHAECTTMPPRRADAGGPASTSRGSTTSPRLSPNRKGDKLYGSIYRAQSDVTSGTTVFRPVGPVRLRRLISTMNP
jgi:hypothetical protein